MALVAMALLLAQTLACNRETKPWSSGALEETIGLLRPFFEPMDKPGPMDWLAHHQEPGQTFQAYLRSKPIRPRGKRRVIYVQPIGTFSEKQRQVLLKTAAFLGCFYNLPVVTKDILPASMVPAKARRRHPMWGDKQMLTSYLLDHVLRPRLPDDAAVFLGLTASDLWPGEGWNFVFGQASIRERVGIWSFYRFGDPESSEAAYALCLRRMLKVAAHETGHMFSILHCTAYKCGMCGSNHLAETDKQPLYFCPECMAKVCWAIQIDPVPRYQALQSFCDESGLQGEAACYRNFGRFLVQGGGPG